MSTGDAGANAAENGSVAAVIAELLGISEKTVAAFGSSLLGVVIVGGLAVVFCYFTAVGRELTKKTAGPLADWICGSVSRLVSGYRRHYLLHAIEFEHRNFDVKGLSTQNIYTLELAQVFVDLSLMPMAAHQASGNPIINLPEELKTGRHSIWQYLKAGDDTPQHFAILGAPGSGKTTLMKHLALSLALRRKTKVSQDIPDLLPVLLFLRDHVQAIVDAEDYTLVKAIEAEIGHLARKPPAGWLAKYLERGRVLILLDGLDEVADPDLRRQVVDWVEKQMQAHGRNRFVVTSRPFGYRDNPLNGVTVLEVRPFNASQVERFVHNWYRANEVKSQQRDDPGVHRDAKKGADDLLNRLRGTPALSDLAVNPLLLTMIATVHRYRSSLPGRRVELYAEICEVFLGKRQQAKGLQLDLTPAQRQTVLEPLAYHMMCEKRREIDVDAAGDVIGDLLARVGATHTAGEFLADTHNNSGLLIERENGVCAFAHLTFQEYLAAAHIQRQNLQGELTTHIADSWWHETIRLYAAQADASPIINACFMEDATSVPALVLAIECEEEAREIAPELRRRLELVVNMGLEAESEPEASRVVSEALLTRRLKRLIRLDDHRYIDGALISNAEYQLFLDDLRRQGSIHTPDHWIGERFARGRADEPILGVRAKDAEDFCAWLTTRLEGPWVYRLPTSEESSRPGHGIPSSTGYWTLDGAQIYGLSHSSTGGERKPLRFPALHFVRDLDRDLDLVRVLVGDLDRVLVGDLDLVRDRVLDPNLARVLVRDLVRDLVGDLDLARDRDLVRDLVRDLDLVRDRVLDPNLARVLDRVRELVRDLDRVLIRDLDLDLVRGLTLVHTLIRYQGVDRRQMHNTISLLEDRHRSFLQKCDSYNGLIMDTLCLLTTSYLLLLRCRYAVLQVIADWPAKKRRKYGLKQAPDHADKLLVTVQALDDSKEQVLELRRRIRGESEPFEGIRIVRERAAAR